MFDGGSRVLQLVSTALGQTCRLAHHWRSPASPSAADVFSCGGKFRSGPTAAIGTTAISDVYWVSDSVRSQGMQTLVYR